MKLSQMQTLKSQKGGFTLVELIVVITILAILATVGFLALQGYTKDAKNTTVKSNISTLMSAINASASTNADSVVGYTVANGGTNLVVPVTGNVSVFSGVTVNTASGTYSAGKPNFTKLTSIDSSKFKDGTRDFGVGAAQQSVYVTGAAIPNQTRSAFQIAGVVDGASYVQGTYTQNVGTDLAGLMSMTAGTAATVIVDLDTVDKAY